MGGSNRVLVIDQDNVRRGMVACTVEGSGYDLEFAGTQETGLDLLKDLEPDVVIVGQDTGTADICQRIRAQQAGTACLLVLMDERFEDESLGESTAEDSGADTFLPFPFEGSLFAQRVAAGKLRRRLQTKARLRPPTPEIGCQAVPALAQQQGHSATAESELWRRFQAEVASFYDQLEAFDYYQILHVSPTASIREIKDAYFKLALQYHPDRLIRHTDEQLKKEVYEVYKRLSEAFMVLMDPVTRRQYEAQLEQERQLGNLRYRRQESSLFDNHPTTADAETPLGRRYLYFSLQALEAGRLRTARSYTRLAIQHEPKNMALRDRLTQLEHRMAHQQTPDEA